MLNKIYNCVTVFKFDDYWKVFKEPLSNRSAAKQFLRTNFNWTKPVKLEEYYNLSVMNSVSFLTQQNDLQILTEHIQQSYCLISETVELFFKIKGCEL